MTRSHHPSHRRGGGGTGTPEKTRGAPVWLRPLTYGSVAWALAWVLAAGTSGGALARPAPQLVLGLLTVPVATALSQPTVYRRLGGPRAFAVHLLAAGGLTSVLYLVSVAAPEDGARALAEGALEGFAGYALVLGATTLGWSQQERQGWHAAILRAQDAATRARLNPHFLFNSLHSLASLVRHNPTAAADAVAVLGDLLRYVLDESAMGDVPLRREWEFVERYIHLERLRLGDRLTVDLQMDPETLALSIPSLCLQPLVENAVRHGIAPRPSGGRVTVTVQLRHESLVIRVSDTGVGADIAAMASAPGLGLRAIRQRIEHRYSGTARLELASSPGRGFTAELVLPVEAALPRSRRPHDRGYAHRR